ncbi:MAG: hypothetical protein ACTS41_01465 [Candidatus Hodgkinia cicadicola]
MGCRAPNWWFRWGKTAEPPHSEGGTNEIPRVGGGISINSAVKGCERRYLKRHPSGCDGRGGDDVNFRWKSAELVRSSLSSAGTKRFAMPRRLKEL